MPHELSLKCSNGPELRRFLFFSHPLKHDFATFLKNATALHYHHGENVSPPTIWIAWSHSSPNRLRMPDEKSKTDLSHVELAKVEEFYNDMKPRCLQCGSRADREICKKSGWVGCPSDNNIRTTIPPANCLSENRQDIGKINIPKREHFEMFKFYCPKLPGRLPQL